MSTEELTAVKRKRGGVEARFTVFKTYLTNLKTQIEIPNLEINRNVYIELESRLERANQLLYEFEQIQNELEEMVGLDKLTEQLDERRAFENTFFETIAEAKGILSDGISAQNRNQTVNAQDNKPAVSVGLSGIWLPQINLPTFVGNYDTWLEFRDTFESLIHFNTTIRDIQKLHYLRASLDGSAKQVIHSLEFSEKNYKVAWDLLKQSMKKLIRIMALWLRYLSNCKIPKTRLFERCTGILTPVELSYAEKRLAYISQKEAFVNELLTLKQGKLITKGSLSSLNPFLDKDGIIRVGGRLQLSEFPYEKMHPIVISAKHPFSKLLFRYEHKNLCHA
ncbi:hypothetical protein NQ314_005086, partial [Rhamnusium bicolor]